MSETNNWVGNLGTLEVKAEPVVAEPVAAPVVAVVEAKVETPVAVVTDTPAKTVEPEKEDTVEVETKMVPQEILGKVLKAQREKYKTRESDMEQRLRALEEENKRLREPPVIEDENQALIAQKVREEFLMREDAYGREKYGDQYQEALDLIVMQNDPLLVSKIQNAAKPADTLVKEAIRIAEELEFGATQAERDKKKEEMLKEKLKKELEAELAVKLAAKNNQPTNVQNIRSAGGDIRPIQSRETWASGRGSLPR